MNDNTLRKALEQIAFCLPTDLANPAPIELWAAKAKDDIRVAREALDKTTDTQSLRRVVNEKDRRN